MENMTSKQNHFSFSNNSINILFKNFVTNNIFN